MATKRKRANASGANRTDELESGTYSLPETARRLGLGTTTIYDLIRRGDAPFGRPDETGAQIHVRLIGGQKRTLVAEVERYLSGAGAAAV